MSLLCHALLAGLAFAAPLSPTYAQKADLPTPAMFAVGDTWEWRQVDQRTKLEEQRITRSVIATSGTLGFSDSAGRELGVSATFTDNTYKPSGKPWRVWPLEVGKKWTMNADWTRADGVTGNTKQDAEVVAYEDVNVPAGKFMAFKIEHRGWFQTSQGSRGKQNDTFWYSPDARADVKHSRDDGYNLYIRELMALKRSTP